MKCHRPPLRQIDESSGRFDVDGGVRTQETEDDAIGTCPKRMSDIAAHDLKLIGVVEKISTAWANHGMDLRTSEGLGRLNRAQARGRATLSSVFAEFDTVGSSTRGNPRRC